MSDDEIKYHTYRGSKSILLLNRLDKKQVNETGWKDFLMQNKNVRKYTLSILFCVSFRNINNDDDYDDDEKVAEYIFKLYTMDYFFFNF